MLKARHKAAAASVCLGLLDRATFGLLEEARALASHFYRRVPSTYVKVGVVICLLMLGACGHLATRPRASVRGPTRQASTTTMGHLRRQSCQ